MGINNNRTQLDTQQIFERSFDPTNDRIRVDAEISASIIAPPGLEVSITAVDDNIAIRNSNNTDELLINPDGSINVTTTPSGTSDINLAQVAGTTTAVNNGTANAGTQRVAIASDNTPFTVNALQSGVWSTRIQDSAGNSLTSTGGALDVNISSGSIDVGTTDQSTFTYGSSIEQPIGGVFQDTSPNLTSGQTGAVRLTQFRAFHINLRDNSGTELGTSGNPLRIDPTGITTQPVNVTNASISVTQGTSPWVISGTVTANIGTTGGLALDSTLSAFSAKFNQDYGSSAGAIRTASQIGNTTGQADFNSGITTTQTLRVVLPTDQTAIPVTQSGVWTTGRTWTLSSGTDSVSVTGTIAVTQSTSPWIISGTVLVSNLPTTVDTNYGVVGVNTIRTASQIGNSTGQADFNAGITSAQTLRVVLPTDQTSIPVTQSGTWTTGRTWTLSSGTDSISIPGTVAVTQSTSPWVVSGTVTSNQGTPNTIGNAWPTKVTDGTDTLLVDADGSAQVRVTNGTGASAVNIQDGGNSITVDGSLGRTWTLASGTDSVTVIQGTSPWVISGSISVVTANDTNYGTVGANTLRTAAQIGNATGAALFGAGTTTAQVLRVVLPTDQTAIPVTQSTSPWVVSGTVTANQGTSPWVISGTVLVSNFPTTVDTNYGVVGANTIRSAAQIGNSTGASDFNAGTTSAQTLRTTANITRNGTELSYNSGTNDANTQRVASNIQRQGNELDYNFGALSANTLKVAAIPGNVSGIADFNAGTTSAQTIRVTSNITRNGTELDYNFGAPSANTIRVASIIGNATGAADFNTGAATAQTLRVTSANLPTTVDTNFGTVGASTLRTAAQIGNSTGSADFNAGTTGAQTIRVTANITRNGTELDYNFGAASANTIRVASLMGNATGAANFNAGATGAQTLRTASNLYDGSANAITSQTIGATQSLNVASQGNIASATTDSGNPVKIGTIFNTTLPTVTNGQRVDAQGDANGRIIVTNVPLDGSKTSYSASITNLVVANTPTDIFTITGSATKTVRITRIGFSGTQNTSSTRNVLLIKRSTANSAGTSTTPTVVPSDSTNAAGTAVVRAYTVNPTLGTTIGTIRSQRFQLLATNVTNPIDRIFWEFGDGPSQAIVIRGTSEVLAVNLNSITSSNNLFDIDIEWTEE